MATPHQQVISPDAARRHVDRVVFLVSALALPLASMILARHIKAHARAARLQAPA